MMLALEEILSELGSGGDEVSEQGLPPGFRFHPTDEELITFYLASKVFNGTFCGVEIAEVDLNRCEPWELPDVAKMGEREWYFFSLRDRKYPTGLRTNRATGAGYWKATGKDREVCSASNGALLGMKKTLVFYRGRAPRGEKTKWVMHEYRLDGDFSYRHTCKEEWVICRIFHKVGEKKNGGCFVQQSYLFESAASDGNTTLPPLMEPSQSQNPIETLQNPFVINQENDLKSLINNNIVVPQPDIYGLLTTTTTNKSPSHSQSQSQSTTSPSMIFKTLLSNQPNSCSTVSATITSTKYCKTEPNFSNFQLPDSSSTNFSSWIEKIQQNPYQNQNQNPVFYEMENCSSFAGVSDAAMTSTPVNDMSISHRPSFQVMFDRESWPLDA